MSEARGAAGRIRLDADDDRGNDAATLEPTSANILAMLEQYLLAEHHRSDDTRHEITTMNGYELVLSDRDLAPLLLGVGMAELMSEVADTSALRLMVDRIASRYAR
ncbi:hypothetical protein RIF23_06415 [Lipingzhangella sp. LS1_29]|uniref:Uncharacterized protein n=1 Tax=Lipingzhangella rawalii TaxID=2055835 RepID=A0ABU2H3Q1_9ACTN|nr:hypothetical protein [Lipingzhangella rawalii]MDS1269926.1 hypothetical protein [Lipingzhangella rawalii]